jgi:hypothetical protein
MNRREVIAGLGSAVAWSVAARAQQTVMPMIGYVSAFARDDAASRVAAVRQGLAQTGYIEGATWRSSTTLLKVTLRDCGFVFGQVIL